MGNLSKKIFSVAHYVANKVQQPAVILLYHRVTTLQQDPQDLSVTPEHFNSHLAHLATDYNLLDAERFLYHIKNKKRPLPERSVFVTFDDGYAANYLEALPLPTEAPGASPLLYYQLLRSIPPSNCGGTTWKEYCLRPATCHLFYRSPSTGSRPGISQIRLRLYEKHIMRCNRCCAFVKPAEIESAMQQLWATGLVKPLPVALPTG